MPLYNHDIQLCQGISLGIWTITETLEQLWEMAGFIDSSELDLCRKFSSVRRQREWLCTRLLMKSVMGKYQPIRYLDSGKPYIPGFNGSLSISHADGMVAVIVAESPAPESAVDVERITPRIERISHKFLRPHEIAAIPAGRRLEHLYIHWCAKEAMYKALNIPDYDYQNSYTLDAVEDSGRHTGRLMRQGTLLARFRVDSFRILDYVICVAYII